MDANQRFKMLVDAPPEVLEAVDAVLTGDVIAPTRGPLLLNITEAARLLGSSRALIYRLLAAGRLEAVALLPGGRQRVRRADIEALAAEGGGHDSAIRAAIRAASQRGSGQIRAVPSG